jgi:hypothetical protein
MEGIGMIVQKQMCSRLNKSKKWFPDVNKDLLFFKHIRGWITHPYMLPKGITGRCKVQCPRHIGSRDHSPSSGDLLQSNKEPQDKRTLLKDKGQMYSVAIKTTKQQVSKKNGLVEKVKVYK